MGCVCIYRVDIFFYGLSFVIMRPLTRLVTVPMGVQGRTLNDASLHSAGISFLDKAVALSLQNR